MANYYIERLNDNNSAKWEEFNNNSNEGSFFHSLKWKQIFENTSNLKTHYFLLFKNNTIFGIFPFVEKKIHMFNGLVPLQGFGHYNAIIRDYRDNSAIQYFITELQRNNENQKINSFICLSTLHKEIIDNLKNFMIFPFGGDGNMILNLQKSPPEKIWENFSAKKGQRKFIRRFDEKGYSITEISSHEEMKLFYRYYKENINYIGGSLQPFSHFTDLWNNLFSEEMRITILSKDSLIAGGLLMFLYKPQKVVYLNYLSLNRDLPNTYHPTYSLFWEAINWAWNNNYEKISFGPQYLDEKNPRYRIKNEFGGEFEPIFSKMIPLNKFLRLGYWAKQSINNNKHIFN
jgi:hypothetical protein